MSVVTMKQLLELDHFGHQTGVGTPKRKNIFLQNVTVSILLICKKRFV